MAFLFLMKDVTIFTNMNTISGLTLAYQAGEAPSNVGSKYKRAEKTPEIMPASPSENPQTLDRYIVNTTKTA